MLRNFNSANCILSTNQSQNMAESKCPQELLDLVLKHKFVNDDDEEYKITAVRDLDSERRNMYATKIPQLKTGYVLSCDSIGPNKEISERIAWVDSNKNVKHITLECLITMDEFSPSGFYKFNFFNLIFF